MHFRRSRLNLFSLLTAVYVLHSLATATKIQFDDDDLYDYRDFLEGEFSGSGDVPATALPKLTPPSGGSSPKAHGSGPTIPLTSNKTKIVEPTAQPSVDTIPDSGKRNSDFSFATPSTTSEAPVLKPQIQATSTVKVAIEEVKPVESIRLPVDNESANDYSEESLSSDEFNGSGDLVAPTLQDLMRQHGSPRAFGSGPTISSNSNNTKTTGPLAPPSFDTIEEYYEEEEDPEYSSENRNSDDFSFATPIDQDKFDDELFSGLTSTTTTSQAPVVKPQSPTTVKVPPEVVTPVDSVTLPVESEISEFDIIKGACIGGVAVLLLIMLTCVLCRCVKKRKEKRRIRDKCTASMVRNGNTQKSDSFRFTSPARRTMSSTQTEPVLTVVTRLPDVAATAAAGNSKLHVDELMPRTFTSFTPSAPVYGATTVQVGEMDKLLDDTKRQLEELERLGVGESNERPKFDYMNLRETSIDEPDGTSRNSVTIVEEDEQQDSFLDNLGPRYR